jgi:hypothetical protein
MPELEINYLLYLLFTVTGRRILCVRGREVWGHRRGGGLRQIKHLPQSPLQVNLHLAFAFLKFAININKNCDNVLFNGGPLAQLVRASC